VAAELLAGWDHSLARFSKVMPTDYKRVLAARERAAREGLDVDTAVMESAHG
jgi:glutamate synthase (NADPH/NADH) large chain